MSKRLFKFLLNLYPGEFRDEYGREMTLLFRDRYRDANSAFDRFSLWLQVLAGIFIEAPKERFSMFQQDLHYAWRTMRNSPLFTATIVLTLALGIGANSAIFSLLNTVILRTLPVDKPQELRVVRIDARRPVPQRFSWPQFERLREGTPGDVIAAMGRVARVHTRGATANEDEIARAQLVSGEYFSVLKVPMAVGRSLVADDNRTPGAHPVAVISHSYWQEHYGGSPDILGREVSLNNAHFSIVGVAAPGFSGVWLESPVQVWVPIAMQKDIRYGQNFSANGADQNQPWMTQQQIWWLDLVVRAPQESETAIAAALNARFHQILSEVADRVNRPEQRKMFLEQRLVLDPFANGFSSLRQSFSLPLYALMAMAGMVLLIACANTANLLLARAAGRQREIALRLSLGAGRLRLVQQLMTENLLLVAMAGVAAVFIARWTGELLAQMAVGPDAAPLPVLVDYKVLGFTAAVALVTGFLFGLAPALKSTRVELSESLKGASRTASAGATSRTTRSLVVLQVALSLVLVVGTGLLIRSLRNLLQFDPGFDREHVLSVTVNPRLSTYTAEQQPEVHRRLLERLESIPGVRGATLAMCGLAAGCRSVEGRYEVEGYQASPNEDVAFLTNIVSPNYFSTVGMPLVAGRAFDERDVPGRRVSIVNETLARRYFANGDAVGKRLRFENTEIEIVGVVRDARLLSIKETSIPTIFHPLKQLPVTAGALDIRTSGDPTQLIAAVRQAMAETAPNMTVERITALKTRIDGTLGQERLVLSLTTAFGALALGLAGFGLFGVLSYGVARRLPEFGVRMALGASPGRITREVLREAISVTALGLAIGFALVVASSKAVSSLLFGVNPNDSITLVVAVAVVIAAAMFAGLVPALRASRVDPIAALRNE